MPLSGNIRSRTDFTLEFGVEDVLIIGRRASVRSFNSIICTYVSEVHCGVRRRQKEINMANEKRRGNREIQKPEALSAPSGPTEMFLVNPDELAAALEADRVSA